MVSLSCALFWNFSSSICSRYLSLFVGVPVEPLVVGVVLAPGLHRVAAGIDQVGIGEMLVVPHAVAVPPQLFQILPEVLVGHPSIIDPRKHAR